MPVVGADVCSLFPSLQNVVTARIAKKAVLDSKVELVDFDYIKALRYVKIVGGEKLIERSGLRRVSPHWLGKRPDLITVGGESAREDKCWRDTKKDLFEHEKRAIVACVVEIVVTVIKGSHV